MADLRSIYTFLEAITREEEWYTVGEALRNVSSYGSDLEEVKHMQKQRCLGPLFTSQNLLGVWEK